MQLSLIHNGIKFTTAPLKRNGISYTSNKKNFANACPVTAVVIDHDDSLDWWLPLYCIYSFRDFLTHASLVWIFILPTTLYYQQRRQCVFYQQRCQNILYQHNWRQSSTMLTRPIYLGNTTSSCSGRPKTATAFATKTTDTQMCTLSRYCRAGIATECYCFEELVVVPIHPSLQCKVVMCYLMILPALAAVYLALDTFRLDLKQA